ncbi:MAG: VWA domain-containing protein [Pirellulaceae bacterium]|nr:VWA domain-containing protein [Pirellulaceae bacterium]
MSFLSMELPREAAAEKPSSSKSSTSHQRSFEPGSSRLAKILLGRNEARRLQALAPLQHNVAARLDAIDELIYVLEAHAQQVANGRELAPSTVEVVELLATINRDRAHQALIHMLDCPTMDIAMVCANALSRHQRHDAIDAIKMQVERPEWKNHYGFRLNLVRSLARMDHPDAYDYLRLIRKRSDGQLLYELNKLLDDVTLDDFRGDDALYQVFKREIRPESMFQAASYSESASRMKLQRQQYYGIDINAKRLMFIIDHSGSMRAPVYGGTRLTRAKLALIRAIKELPEDHEFSIVFYESAVRVWRPELVYASEKNKTAAYRFINQLGYGGSTNTYGALRRALEFDDDLEAVFLLSDGIPTSGPIVSPTNIIRDIVHRNRLRHLTINTIGISLNAATRNFLRTLADRCDGAFREVEDPGHVNEAVRR